MKNLTIEVNVKEPKLLDKERNITDWQLNDMVEGLSPSTWQPLTSAVTLSEEEISDLISSIED